MSVTFGKLIIIGICILFFLTEARSIWKTNPSRRPQVILQLIPVNICFLVALIGALADKPLIAIAGFVMVLVTFGVQYFLRLPPGYLTAHKLFKAGNKQGALEQINKSIESRPKSAEGYYLRSLINLSQMQLAEAKSDIAKIEELKPDSPLSILADGQLFYLQGEYSKAKECFTNACNSWSTQLCLGQLSYRLGEYDEAVKTLKTAILGRLPDEQKLLAYFYLGSSEEKLGRIKEADRAFDDMKRYARALEKLKQTYKPWSTEYPEIQVMQEDFAEIEELLE